MATDRLPRTRLLVGQQTTNDEMLVAGRYPQAGANPSSFRQGKRYLIEGRV